MLRFLILLQFLIFNGAICFSQEKEVLLKNQASLNITYLVLGSPNLSYELILSKSFAIGLSGVLYGNIHGEKDYLLFGYKTRANFEINPFGRWYVKGTQRKSHFLEFLASYNQYHSSEQNVRVVNNLGYGLYKKKTQLHNNFGLGVGYGYRFLLANKKLVLEVQFSLRTNFEVQYLSFDAAVVRTGIKVGYRF